MACVKDISSKSQLKGFSLNLGRDRISIRNSSTVLNKIQFSDLADLSFSDFLHQMDQYEEAKTDTRPTKLNR